MASGARPALDTFDDIYLLDLHGNSNKKERSPDGSKDQNVFDIQQGVAISIFVKRKNGKKDPATVHHAHLWGVREIYENNDAHGEPVLSGGKYYWLWNRDLTTTKWNKLDPQSPFYLFMPQDTNLRGEYEEFRKITEILPMNNVGIVTARDALTIHFTKEDVWSTVTDFASLPTEEARSKYVLGKDAQDWKVDLAQRDLNASGPSKERIIPILYRPYDLRYTYYTGNSRGFHCRARADVMRNMLAGSNLALITTRQTRDEWHVLASNNIVGHKSLAGYDINTLFPLYVYPAVSKENLFDHPENNRLVDGRRPNLAHEFIQDFAARLKLEFISARKGDCVKSFGPEDFFDYIYTVFHSPTYRSRYSEFLKMDFPRLPLTSNAELFRKLCALGSELVDLHLMDQQAPTITTYPIAGDNGVENVRYTAPGEGGSEQGRAWINREQCFEGVPPEVWSFHVGGYQVCQKWLKDRKGRKLTYDDLTHYQRIISALNETLRSMPEIDTVIENHGGWPIS